MTKFTDSNTEGFSASDLEALNAALEELSGAQAEDVDHISDRLNNLWVDGDTAATLIAKYTRTF